MKNASELLEEAVYAGNLSENEEKRLYSWIESLILAKRKYDEDEAKAKAWDKLMAEIDRITEEAAVKEPPPNTTLINKVIAVTMAKKELESGESDA